MTVTLVNRTDVQLTVGIAELTALVKQVKLVKETSKQLFGDKLTINQIALVEAVEAINKTIEGIEQSPAYQVAVEIQH